MGGCQDLGGVHMPPYVHTPHTSGHPIHLDTPICSKF